MSKPGFYFRHEDERGVVNTLIFPDPDATWKALMIEFKRFLEGSGYRLPEEMDD